VSSSPVLRGVRLSLGVEVRDDRVLLASRIPLQAAL
jgi:hypothetical protein